MEDRELEELAAKAAGIKLKWLPVSGFFLRDDVAGREEWVPLDDDAQALQLAVKLRFEVNNVVPDAPVFVYAANPGMLRIVEEKGGDPLAATRRAIVRAAAEIGKQQGQDNQPG